MELQQLRYVIAVAETGGFTRAAERCLVVQSALSHQIARLERELGARLFERTSRRVSLTPAGAAFLPAARQCLEAADRAAAEVAAAVGEVRGRLAVGLIPTVTAVDIPGALRDFHERYPRVRISLRVGASDDLVVDLPAGTAGRLQSDEAFEAAGLTRDVAYEVTTADYTARLVAPGLAIALLPAAWAPSLNGVTVIPVLDAPQRVECAIWGRETRTPAAAAFLEILKIPHTIL
ncbi:LysR family transcriptional regulator [Catenulispora sp. MAP12-49]|uniref:LysR family transcriptional regulator n=1 Tax=Catenulispora sp. MAP12-49 TaxID=3156302 RepID=UPI003512AC1B